MISEDAKRLDLLHSIGKGGYDDAICAFQNNYGNLSSSTLAMSKLLKLVRP